MGKSVNFLFICAANVFRSVAVELAINTIAGPVPVLAR